jgi:hypothetical protein
MNKNIIASLRSLTALASLPALPASLRSLRASIRPLRALVPALLLLFACSRTAPSSPIAITQNPTSYELLSIVWSGPPPNTVGIAPTFGQAVYFTYNSNNLLTDYRRLDWGGDSIPSSGPPDTNYYNYHLEYTNGLVSRMDHPYSGGESWNIYTYNTNAQVLSVKGYTAGNIFNTETDYQYDSHGNRVLEAYSDGGQLLYHITYVFDNNDNILSKTDSTLWSTQNQVARTVYNGFDNKVNFLKAINGFPGDEAIYWYPLTASNNPTSQISYPAVFTGQPFGAGIPQTFSYEYNDEGLPTIIRTGSQVITLTYRKFR